MRGKMKVPSRGYSSPKEVRGIHHSGLKPVVIENIKQLQNLKKGEGAILSRKSGEKKKLEIAKKAKELQLQILNIKDIDGFIKKIEEERENIKLKKKKQVPVTVVKRKIEKKESQEEKLKREKEEKRRILEGKA